MKVFNTVFNLPLFFYKLLIESGMCQKYNTCCVRKWYASKMQKYLHQHDKASTLWCKVYTQGHALFLFWETNIADSAREIQKLLLFTNKCGRWFGNEKLTKYVAETLYGFLFTSAMNNFPIIK